MIAGLRGEIVRLEPMYAELDVGGVIYGLHISLNTSNALQAQKAQGTRQMRVICTQIIREDAHLLFGFMEEIEKQTFERLIKISGVGPKVAMAILSAYTPQEFSQIVANKDIDALKRVPGIGTKGAGKILVDIAGFFASLMPDSEIHSESSPNHAKSQASLALASLGFKEAQIDKALRDLSGEDVSSLVKEALKILHKI